MIIVDIKIGIDGVPSEKSILLGNKYENNDTIVNFDLPADFDTYKKYIITVNGNTTRILPLTDDRLVVSSALTELAGNWAMYLMCRETTIDLSVDNPDISAKENEHVFISDGFIGTVANIQIDRRFVESIPMDTNLQIAYDDLMDLKAELLARIAGIDEYYEKTNTNTQDISTLKTNKVDKVPGKGLSTEDYTTEEKSKLAGLSNYDDTTVKQDISTLKTNKVDKVPGKGLSTNDFTNEEKEKLSGLSNYDDSEIKSDLNDLKSDIANLESNIGFVKDKLSLTTNGSYAATYESYVSSGMSIDVTADASYKIVVVTYTDNTKVTKLSDSGWLQEANITFDTDCYMEIKMRRNDYETITDSELSFCEAYIVYRQEVFFENVSNKIDELKKDLSNIQTTGLVNKKVNFTLNGTYKASYEMQLTSGMTVKAQLNSDYKIVVVTYTDNTKVTKLSDSGWLQEANITFDTDRYCEIAMRRNDYAEFTDEDSSLCNVYIVGTQEVFFENVSNEIRIAEKNMDAEIDRKTISTLNIFSNLPIYHHMNQEVSNPYIPAQSLYDIHYAKSLGFDLIEVNTHQCQDGVFVCKHGIQGKLGNGIKSVDGEDYSQISFSDVTSEWLRSNIRYDAQVEKYCGYIPTLDEFCEECKKLSMRVKIASLDRLSVVRKYLTDDMIWITSTTRDDFRGTIEYVHYKSESLDGLITKCKEIGTPLNVVIAAGEFDSYSDSELSELVTQAHINGFTVGHVYPTSNSIIRALSCGVDCIGSVCNNVNIFTSGNAKNIFSLSDAGLILSGGATYDESTDTIIMPENAEISVNADNVQTGTCCARLVYDGNVSVSIGTNNDACNLTSYANDMTKEVYLANVLPKKIGVSYNKWVTIKANSQSVIGSLKISMSII